MGDLGSVVVVWKCGSVATGSHFHTGSVRPQARTDFPGAIASHRFGQQAGATKLAETRRLPSFERLIQPANRARSVDKFEKEYSYGIRWDIGFKLPT